MLIGYPLSTALTVGTALGQIGEFSFIVAALGKDLGVLPPAAMNTMVAVSIVSIVVNPLLFRALPFVQRWLATLPMLARLPSAEAPADAGEAEHQGTAFASRAAHRAVVVGYGPTGRTLTRLLAANGLEPCAIEMNIETVRALRKEGICAVYGDATLTQTLEAAGVANRAEPDPERRYRERPRGDSPGAPAESRRTGARANRTPAGSGRAQESRCRCGLFRRRRSGAGVDRSHPASARRYSGPDRSRTRSGSSGASRVTTPSRSRLSSPHA